MRLLERLTDQFLLERRQNNAAWRQSEGIAAEDRCPEVFPDVTRQLLRRHHRPLAEDHGALDGVFQLPDVAGPGVAFEQTHRLLGYADDLLAKFLAIAP